jgi:hypothetical protein
MRGWIASEPELHPEQGYYANLLLLVMPYHTDEYVALGILKVKF